MNDWKKHGTGYVSAVTLTDGGRARIVVVGPRQDEGGALAVSMGEDGSSVESLPLAKVLDKMTPYDVLDVLCMQERCFGDSGLPPVE